MAAPGTSPLKDYLTVQQQYDRVLAQQLVDAANEAHNAILHMAGDPSVGIATRRAQMQVLKKELYKQAEDLWPGIGSSIEGGMHSAAASAAAGTNYLNRLVLNEFGAAVPALEAAIQEQAKHTVDLLIARGTNGIPLAESVYGAKNLANKSVDKVLANGLLLGKSAKEIADSVKHLIDPNVKGGVSYAAMRLGRTEINNAFHTVQQTSRQEEPWTTAFKWNLSGSHPKPDECNEYAETTHFKGGGQGEFLKMEVPAKPHPNCLCYLTPVQVSDEEFLDSLVKGKYSGYMDKTIYNSGIGTVC